MNYSLLHHIWIGLKTLHTILPINCKIGQTIYFKDELSIKKIEGNEELSKTNFAPSVFLQIF